MGRILDETKRREQEAVESGDFAELFEQLEHLDCVAAYDTGLMKLARSLRSVRTISPGRHR